jgi:ABC-2 type transport system permease protein
MPARNLLAGKITGIGLLGLGQVVATALVALAAGAIVDSIEIPALDVGVVTWAVIWFLLGYALYATVYGTLGSLASRTEDASSVTGPVTVVLILAFLVSFATIGSLETTWARVVALFPLTAPLAMPNRIAMGAATWWEPIVAAVLTVATIGGLVVLGGRIYTRAILHTGSTLSLGDAWRGAAPSPTASVEGAPPAATTTSVDRIPLVLVVLALVAGGVVFAITKDFVIGVAVGAAGCAVAVRASKALRRRQTA